MSPVLIGACLVLLGAAGVAFVRRRRLLCGALVLLVLAVAVTRGFGLPPDLAGLAIAAALLAVAAALSAGLKWSIVRFSGPAVAREFRTAPLTASFGILVILLYSTAALFAPWIAPHGEAEVISSSFAPPSSSLLLGADQLGRDIFSRIIYGARNSVGLALAATLLAFLLGAVSGLLAAIKGGIADQVLGRIADILMSVPALIFALLMLSIFGTGLLVIVLVIAVIYAPRVFRLTRAVAGNVVVMDYVEAARLRGEGDWYLIRREILPNAAAPLVAEFGLEFCFVFLLIAGLSFLGLGVQPPTADWGSMVRENATLISFGDMTPLIPAGAIALLTVSVNFVVDWMLLRSSGLKE
ncbi:peptide/nickel transport system permease protein [Palleronia aestuarii]|uniref:Peptide/nickel transport system permease protein n=1 Tax=Palleronia aestuarii TaxID=568105 RepID=A0A2W7N350_9RHOB|nr:ABC transporter permease [Palleronia aestuarii]PZX14510.1 peptide/nickel transport system permease protein [Palleronia aestuarii]